MSSYDDVPYPSYVYWASQPEHLWTMAHLVGLSPAPLEQARVLEIGCGQGVNLFAMATALPSARFVGIEPSGQVAQARALASSLGLRNVELHRCSIEDVDAGFGQFDWIVCHGVLSWVPDGVRDCLLSLCSRHLAPAGIAYLSHNAYPGWHQGDMLRRILLHHVDPEATPSEKVRRARELLEFLADVAQETDDLRAPFLGWIRDQWRGYTDGYLFHEYFSVHNRAYYLHELVALAAHAGLSYLGDAEPKLMHLGAQPAPLAAALLRCRTMLEAQQYLDFARNVRFRRSLFCRPEQKTDHAGASQRLAGLYARLDLTDPLSEEEDGGLRVMGRHGAAVVNGPAVGALIRELAEAAPGAVALASLAPELATELASLWWGGVIDLHPIDHGVGGSIPEHPTATGVARWEAARRHKVSNRWHSNRQLSHEDAALLATLDGRRACAELRADGLLDAAQRLNAHGFLTAVRSTVGKD